MSNQPPGRWTYYKRWPAAGCAKCIVISRGSSRYDRNHMKATLHKQDGHTMCLTWFQTGEIVARGAVLAVSCAISYWVITRILANTYSVSRDDDLLGGMWAVAATIFVYRYCHAESVSAALSCMAATTVSFALCLVYLLIFPFHVWGMAALIGTGAVVVTIMGRPDDTITTGITI